MSSHKMRIGVSACLLGDEVRFDGGHKRDQFLTDVLDDYVEWIPSCPEIGAGFGTPRESMRLMRNGGNPRVVTNRSGTDVTDRIERYTHSRVNELSHFRLRGYILKSNSPSCGMERVRLYSGNGAPTRDGVGVFARELMARYPALPVEEEGRLRDYRIRENFITRVFAYDRWLQMLRGNPVAGDVVRFHSEHKMLLLAHDPEGYRELGRVVAAAGTTPIDTLLDTYEVAFMTALKRIATPGRHANVLEHLAGHLKQDLSSGDKRELHGSIHDYRLGRMPLIAPLLLLGHYIRHLRDDWLHAQFYLQPYPAELALRSAI